MMSRTRFVWIGGHEPSAWVNTSGLHLQQARRHGYVNGNSLHSIGFDVPTAIASGTAAQDAAHTKNHETTASEPPLMPSVTESIDS
jgi:hypothetical protein